MDSYVMIGFVFLSDDCEHSNCAMGYLSSVLLSKSEIIGIFSTFHEQEPVDTTLLSQLAASYAHIESYAVFLTSF